MSRILWSNVFVPEPDKDAQPYTSEFYGDKITIPRTKSLSIEERKALLPDRKAFRSMSRASVLLSLACLEARASLNSFLVHSPFEVGIYCAVENGPVDLRSASAMREVSADDFADEYKRVRNPKLFLKQVPNLAPAQMAIFLGTMGPLNVYNHSSWGCVHAFDQAEADIQEGRVKAALVCSAFSFEDPIVLEGIRRKALKDRVLCEGAGAMLLVPDASFRDWSDHDFHNSESYYGISHQLIIHILSRGKT